MSIVILFISSFLGIMYLTSGIAKAANFKAYLLNLENYDLIPMRLTLFVGVINLIVEVILGLFFLVGIYLGITTIISVVLLFFYTLMIMYQIHNGSSDFSCGCGGILGEYLLSKKLILRNVILIIISMFFLIIKPDVPLSFQYINVSIIMVISLLAFIYNSITTLIHIEKGLVKWKL